MLTPSLAPLALYVHWPFCRAKCPYCDFNSHVREGVEQDRWREALLTELNYIAKTLGSRRLASIFFGGGTPSLMPPATVAAVIDAATRHFSADDDIEITLEANPTSAEAASFRDFRASGVNRLSLGVQALNAQDLQFLGRQHDAQEALDAVALAASVFPRYSFDLIYARPGQTEAAWEQELREALKHAGTHLSLYQLTIEENTAFYHAYGKGAFRLPEDEQSAALFRLTQDIMQDAGLPAYEISNHAAPGSESRHNLAYWRGEEYAGIGPGAHGRVRAQQGGAIDDGWVATQAIKSPERWLEAVEKRGQGYELWQNIPADIRREERLMMRLRLSEGFPRAAFDDVSEAAITRLIKQELLEAHAGMIRPTAKGTLLLNYVTAELLS